MAQDAITLSVLAVNQHQALHIQYEDMQGRATERDVVPYYVTQARDGRTYVWAYCRLRQEERTFRVDRIASAELGEEVLAQEYLQKCKRMQYPMVGGTFLAQVTGLYRK